MNGLIGLIVLGLNVFATVDIFKGTFSTGKKVLWAAIVWVFPVIGLIVYFLVGKKK